MTATDSLSSTMYAASERVSRELTGTTTAPMRATPFHTAKSSALLRIITATLSPGQTLAAWRRRATWLTIPSSCPKEIRAPSMMIAARSGAALAVAWIPGADALTSAPQRWFRVASTRAYHAQEAPRDCPTETIQSAGVTVT